MVYLWKTCNKKREWSFKAILIMKPEVAAPLVPNSMLHILWTTLLSIHFNIISLCSWSSKRLLSEMFSHENSTVHMSLFLELQKAESGSPLYGHGRGGLLVGQFVLSISTPSWIAGWYVQIGAMQWLRPSVTGLSIRSSGSSPRLIHMGFMVDISALGQVFLRMVHFYPVSIIPPMHHSHSFTYHQHCIILAIKSIVK